VERPPLPLSWAGPLPYTRAMFRIRRLYALTTAAERQTMDRATEVFDRAFPNDPQGGQRVAQLIAEQETPMVEYILLLAEDGRGKVLGFAFVHDYKDVRFGYLEWIASDPATSARGIGGALYEAAREEMQARGARGLFLEVPTDDPEKIPPDAPDALPVREKRMAFYERYGARPIDGTLYAQRTTPAREGAYFCLVYDSLGRRGQLRRAAARQAVFRILTREYGLDPRDPHVIEVVRSIRADPVALRPPRYVPDPPAPAVRSQWIKPLKLVVGERHEIHHLRAKGYVERPVRVRAVLHGMEGLSVEQRPVRRHGLAPIRAVHDAALVAYLEEMCPRLGEREMLYPEVFPIRRPDRRPRTLELRAGYFCIDTFTPLTRNVWPAARAAVNAALTAADLITQGERAAYALIRPPGHHAERSVYGGFCYLNNTAIAAQRLRAEGRVAVLDVDHHHGNGTQDIFWERDDVLTLSLHGDPRVCYPHFAGFADERGAGAGLGFNRNFPLPDGTDTARYMRSLDEALHAITRFKPDFLVLALGFDLMKGDPTGTFEITPAGMRRIGERIGGLRLPTLVVQEGGYSALNLRRGAYAFFGGLLRGLY
jgi:acetoin utilization deacetylase AcuC-like enzyme/ribosomal protein S18 acetylase RimI-like enzyme